MIVVNRFIGVNGGYLNGFSYRTLADFYPEYCDLDINPFDIEGTSRQRFITILQNSAPLTQAKILRGLLDRFPDGGEDYFAPQTRTPELRQEIKDIISRLESMSLVSNPTLVVSSEVVLRAINDAETLIRTNGATSGVDRVHTALHGYLMAVCDREGIARTPEATLNNLFKLLQDKFFSVSEIPHRNQDIIKIVRACSSIMDSLNPVRNQASVAHPNENLLEKEEALLVINVARTLLHYFDSKISAKD